MPKDWVELDTLRIPFDSLLNLITKAITEHNGFILPKRFKSQKNVNIKLLRWLVDQNVVEIKFRASEKERLPTTSSIKSRKRKIEISLQLHALGVNIYEIARKFGVKESTAKGYLKDLLDLNLDFLKILKKTLALKSISINSALQNYPDFPIYIEANKLQNFDNIDGIVKQDKQLKYVSGRNLGSFNLEIQFPVSS